MKTSTVMAKLLFWALIPLMTFLQMCKKDNSSPAVISALKESISEPLYNVTTYAGVPHLSGTPAKSVDGRLPDAQFITPYRLAMSDSGNIYVNQLVSTDIRKISPNGLVSTLTDQFYHPTFITVDKNENVYVLSGTEGINLSMWHISKVAPNGTISILSSIPRCTSQPRAIRIGPDGALYLAGPNAVWRIAENMKDFRFAGSGRYGWKDGTKEESEFGDINDIAFGPDGSLVVADGHLIRRVTRDGYASTLAGKLDTTGNPTHMKDGPASEAVFGNMTSIDVDKDGIIYAGDAPCIRKITSDGYVTTIAGKPLEWAYKDGVGPDARFETLFALRILGDYLYTIEYDWFVIRRMKIH